MAEFEPVYLEAITEENPDLILIGNSMLGRNVLERLLEKKLTKDCGRKINVYFITKGGLMSSWWYLILRNHVVPANIGETPVGVVYRDENILKPRWKLRGRFLTELKKDIRGDEISFIEKAGIEYNGFPYLITNKGEIKSDILNRYLKNIQDLVNPSWNFTDAIENVFSLDNLGEVSGEIDQDIIPSNVICENLSQCANITFLPDMIEVMENHTLFFIQTHRDPKNEAIANRYEEEISRYFKDNNITRIPLHKEERLNNPDQYGLNDHFTKEYRTLNTIILAEKIVDEDILLDCRKNDHT